MFFIPNYPKMSRIYKLCITSYYNQSNPIKMFVIRPRSNTFESFKEEIFRRFPDVNRQKLELYYEDADSDIITIIGSDDFDLFERRKIERIFVVINNLNGSSFYVKSETTKTSTSTPKRSNSTVDIGSVLQLKEEAERTKVVAKNPLDTSTSTKLSSSPDDTIPAKRSKRIEIRQR